MTFGLNVSGTNFVESKIYKNTEVTQMKRYFIEDAQCGITEGGMACGPVGGNVVATVRFKESPEAACIGASFL